MKLMKVDTKQKSGPDVPHTEAAAIFEKEKIIVARPAQTARFAARLAR